MKRIFSILLAGLTVFTFSACGSPASQSSSQSPSSQSSSQSSSSSSQSQVSSVSQASSESQSSSQSQVSSKSSASSESQASSSEAASQPQSSESDPVSSQPEASSAGPEESAGNNILVVYFSASGNTKAVAETIAEITGGELYELVPVEPYTSDDLNWTVPTSRVNTEHENPDHRTAISGTKDLSSYDTIFIGYPLWWQQAPSIVWNFVETSDLSGKTMIPFCTSTSSPFGSSGETLAAMAPNANWQEGQRFGERLNESEVTTWVDSLGL